MGKCRYCGEPAGFFSSYHKECHALFNEGRRRVLDTILQFAESDAQDFALGEELNSIAKQHYLSPADITQVAVLGWEQAVESAFEDTIITPDEENQLGKIIKELSLTQEQLDVNGKYTQLVQGIVLRKVLDGETPSLVTPIGHLPFNFLKKEQLVWLFKDVDYYEQKKQTHYVGGSQGMSIRIAKGIYYRVGAFKGQRVETHENTYVDTGLMGITDHHIYFSSPTKSFRIKYEKIVSFEPFSDGIGVQRDATTAKPQIFVTNNGWFTYNLISNLAQR